MKKLHLLCAGTLYACVLTAQPSFQTSLEAGISLPLNSNQINATHAGKAIHFGNHLDYSFGNGAVRFGLGAYIGYINSIETDNKYKEIGESIAEKYRFSASQLSFNSSAFKSTQVLLGPVASFGSDRFAINMWAKAGCGLNEPSRYAVLYKENGVVSNVYSNQAGEHTNGLAYSLGAGIKYALSTYTGFLLQANYFSTQTDQVNYNFDREKGLAPSYYTAANQFIQLSAGLQFSIGNPGKKEKTALSETGTVNPVTEQPAFHQKIKTKSNIKNDRLTDNDDGVTVDEENDSLFFSPEKIELGARVADPGADRTQLQTVDNYLTGFVYQGPQGNVLSQCGVNAMPGEPVPGIDVRLRRTDAPASDVLTARTNRDGSFAFNNIAPGDYNAEAGKAPIPVTVIGNKKDDFRILDIPTGSCSSVKENYIINAGDKTYVEIISAGEGTTGRKHLGNIKYNDISTLAPRDAATGLASGRRMHKPYRVTDMNFTVNMDNIVTSEGKVYAEVITAREASSGLATGRSTLITGDVDGDGLTDYTTISPRDAASGLPTGKRMHKPFVITKEVDAAGMEIVSPRDAASGLPTGKRMHKPFVITKELDAAGMEIVSPRDAASGLPTGKRMHKPFIITKELDATGMEIVSPRDAASGLPTGKRMHKPFVITLEYDEENHEIVSPRDASTGLPTGRRVHQPLVIRMDPDADSYSIVSPRDAASGLPTGKRMHKPFVITKELGYNEGGNEVAVYTITPQDSEEDILLQDDEEAAAQKMAITEQGLPKKTGHKKGIITGKDNDTGMLTEREAGSGLATGRRVNNDNTAYQPWDDEVSEAVVSNPLYESSGASGQNPLFESKQALRVTGGDGKTHDIFIPTNFIIEGGSQPLAQNSPYGVGPVKWMAPESLNTRVAGKGISEKGIKRSEAADKGIQENGVRKNEAQFRKGWDGTVKGGSIVKEISRVHCADGSCTLDALVEVYGVVYEAVITGIMKTKHETVKNSIGNIR
ncbi:MAG: hypothetical protein ABI813_11540 [Bacteroidota bacterium]